MGSDKKTEPYRPSNGTEGEIFYAHWCAHCHREQGARNCRIFGRSMAFNVGDPGYPKEWVRDAGDWPGNPRCTAYEEHRKPVRHAMIKDKRQVRMFDA